MITRFKSTQQIYNSNFLFVRKRFEILGTVPIGTYCYVCGFDANCKFNNFNLCNNCYDELVNADKNSYVFNRKRYYSAGKNQWCTENFLKPHYDESIYMFYNQINFNFYTKYPNEMLKFAFLYCFNNQAMKSNIPCINCCKGTNEVCKECLILAILYFFELEPLYYFYLKLIYTNDIASYIMLHYFELKLKCCIH